jgi:hypothetical protein
MGRWDHLSRKKSVDHPASSRTDTKFEGRE